MSTLPEPKFAVGAEIFLPRIERTVDNLPCPDCFDTGEWAVTSPAGGTYTIGCPRCRGTVVMADLPPLVVERWVPDVTRYIITGIAVRTNPTDWQPSVEYSCAGNQSIAEDKAFATRDEAMAEAERMAAARFVAVEASPKQSSARHLGNMTLDNADLHSTWSSRWNAWWAYRELREMIEDEKGGSAQERIDGALEEVRSRFHRDRIPELGKALAALRAVVPSSPEIDAHFAVLMPPEPAPEPTEAF